MAGVHLARRETVVAINTGDLAGLDRRIARLEKAAGVQLSRLLSEGLDPAVASHAARDLTEELADARRHRAQMAAWQASNAEHHNQAERLAELAGHALQIRRFALGRGLGAA